MKTAAWALLLIAGQAQAAGLAGLTGMRTLQMQDIERQTLDYSCGAAALAILLRSYFGQAVDEEDVLADLISRLSREELAERIKEGFSLLDLKQAAQRLGYSAEGLRLTMAEAMLLQGPVIILLQQEKLKHFVVLKGVTQGRALLADSVRGHVRMPLFELSQQWRGETLVIGRAHFGLPSVHRLALPANDAIAPERESVRALRSLPLN